MLTIVPVVRKNKLGKTCIVKLNIQLCKNEKNCKTEPFQFEEGFPLSQLITCSNLITMSKSKLHRV